MDFTALPYLLFPHIDVKYHSNTEYRALFRQITQMDTSKYVDNINTLPDVDDETLDEYNFDNEQVDVFLNKIVQTTMSIPEFQHIYELAAARMFSIDKEIGITILLSYDYLYLFYPLLCDFIHTPSSFQFQSNTYYTELLRKLS
jgi:hypothetical protein